MSSPESSAHSSSQSEASTPETDLENDEIPLESIELPPDPIELPLEPIPLPLNTGKIVLPPQTNPNSTAQDVCRADMYETESRVLYNSIRYKNQVVARADPNAPAWFGPAINHAVQLAVNQAVHHTINRAINHAMNRALRPVQKRLDRMDRRQKSMRKDIREVKREIREVKARLTSLEIRAAKTDSTCGKIMTNFVWEPRYHLLRYLGQMSQPLPELTSAAAVHNLDGHQSRKYFDGYYPNEDVPSVNIRAKAILRAIGCIDASRVGT